MKLIVISSVDGDWERLYINNKLYYENHSIPTEIWLRVFEDMGYAVLEQQADETWFNKNNKSWIEDINLPVTKDIKV